MICEGRNEVNMSVTKPYCLQWFYRKRLVTKVYYTCTWLHMINFTVKDYILRAHTGQCTIKKSVLWNTRVET